MKKQWTHQFLQSPLIFGSLGIFILLALIVPVTISQAQEQVEFEAEAVVTTGKLNVREGSSAGYTVIAQVELGDSVTILARNANQSWAKVRLADNSLGWVSTAYIRSDSMVDLTAFPVEGTVEPHAWVITPLLNVRSGPGVEYSTQQEDGVPRQLTSYALVSVVGRTYNGDWLLIREDSKQGWVNAAFIANSISNRNLPIVEPDVLIVPVSEE